MAPSKALATRAGGKSASPAKKQGEEIEQASIVLSTIPTIDQVIQALEERSQFWVDESDQEAGESMLLSKLRNAKNADDLAKESELDSPKDRLGEWLLVQTVDAIRNSDFKESTFGVYLIVTATTGDGELIKLGVGAAEPFATIVSWNEWGALPRWIRFDLAEKATKGGFYPVNVTDAEYVEGVLPF